MKLPTTWTRPSPLREACGNKRRWPHAQQLFTALRKRRLQPTDVTVSATVVEPWKGWKGGELGDVKEKVQCGAPKIAKLVNITPITMVYGTYNYS